VEKYRLVIKPSALKEIEKVSEKAIRQRLVRGIGRLADEPRPQGCRKLSGHERYRLRFGNYRVVYAVVDVERTVRVVKVGHRKEIYREEM
jgi:mRNA interferase RelE/StbE